MKFKERELLEVFGWVVVRGQGVGPVAAFMTKERALEYVRMRRKENPRPRAFKLVRLHLAS